MSVTVLSRVFWTEFTDLTIIKAGKTISVSPNLAKLHMLAIADNADDFGENSWQSFETIAQKASVKRRSSIRVIQILIANDYLSIAGKTRYGTNDYKINLSKLGYAPESRARIGRPFIGDSSAIIGDSVDTNKETIGDSSAIIGVQDATIGDVQSPESSFNHPLTKTSSLSEETKKAIQASPAWAIAAGLTYEPDEAQVALQNIRDDFDKIMRVNAPWERWKTFDRWLLLQEGEGRPVKQFCEWFVKEKFRRESVGMWTPKGNKDGQWSFMAVYPQAFPVQANHSVFLDNSENVLGALVRDDGYITPTPLGRRN